MIIKKLLTLIIFFLSTSVFALDGKIPWTVQNFRTDSGEMYFAVAFHVPKDLSLYWKNPGDSGAAPSATFYLNKRKIELKEVPWKVPTRKVLNKKLWTYNLDDTVILFYKVPGKKQDQIYDQDITIRANWLVCADLCLPGSGSISGHYIHDKFSSYTTPSFIIEDKLLKKELDQRPKKRSLPLDFEFELGKIGPENYILFYSTSVKNNPKYKKSNLLYPHSHPSINFDHEQLMHDKNNNLYGIVKLNGKVKLPLTLNFLATLDSEYRVSKVELKNYTPGLKERIQNYRKMFTSIEPQVDKTHSDKNEQLVKVNSVWHFLLFAFIGGLILNVMPCVLPVISIKLFGLIKINGTSHKEILTHNLLYTAGILLSFASLAAVVISLKMAGESIGWGFQMQSPRFLLFMIIALIIFAFNMFGLFEFKTPGGKLLGNLSVTNHHLGSFLSGILATVLSTPCSAPFLGTALTFAFTATNGLLFGTLLMIGFGLSFPILLTGIFPQLINFLPRPGNWMNHLKKFLGLSLLVTAVWLVSIFYSLTCTHSFQTPVYSLVIIVVLILMAFILYRLKKYLGWGFAISALTLSYVTYNMETVEFPTTESGSSIAGSEWVKWSPTRVEEYKGKQVLFIKFSADWCITCKVDNRLIIETKEFEKLIQKHNLALMIGDYTFPNPEMTGWMEKHSVVGVPGYIIQYKNGLKEKVKGQLTLEKLDKMLGH